MSCPVTCDEFRRDSNSLKFEHFQRVIQFFHDGELDTAPSNLIVVTIHVIFSFMLVISHMSSMSSSEFNESYVSDIPDRNRGQERHLLRRTQRDVGSFDNSNLPDYIEAELRTSTNSPHTVRGP